MSKLRIGFVLTGSFCTFAKVMPVIQALIERGDTVTPILSDSPLSRISTSKPQRAYPSSRSL